MTREQLQSAGAALYGPRWQSELARSIDVNPRLVRFWVAGDRPIPDWVGTAVDNLIFARSKIMQDALDRSQ